MSADSHYVGKVVKAVSARLEEKVTEPPPRYTEDSLMKDMVAAHKFAKSDQERSVLRETEGLGTARTREPTITAHIRKQMLVSKKKGKRYELTSSPMARATIDALPEMLTGVATTAKWEVAFKMIERGQATNAQLRGHLRSNLVHLMEIAKSSKGKVNLPAGNTNTGQNSNAKVQGSNPKANFTKGSVVGTSQPQAVKTSQKPTTGAVAAIKKWF